MRHWAGAALACATYMGAVPALAQSTGPSLSLEAASEERRRGLSWSAGDPVLRTALSVPLTSELSLDATAVTLRSSARHGGADAVIDLQAGYTRRIGAWSLSAQATYHAFPGASGQGFAEIGAGAGFMIGPASLDAFARYAPDQGSIGGDNLYLGASLAAGIPGTPLTLSGHVGHSSGSVDDPTAARRLRPGGSYWDHGVALDYRKGRWFAGLRYANSSVGDSAAHAGPTAVAHVGIGF
ncbi:MAG TPA: TorF family putative porin [Sphingobium sp.]